MNLAKWIDTYFGLRGDLADASERDQRTTAKMLLKHFGPGRDIATITRLDAATWRASLDGSDATVRKHTRNARTLFGVMHGAMKFDLVTFNPFDREPSAPPQLDNDWFYLDLDDFERLLRACRYYQRGRLAVLAGLSRLAGLRLNEAKRLSWRDVDLKANRIVVTPATRKVTTKQKRRIVPVCPRLARMLFCSRATARLDNDDIAGLPVADFGQHQDALRPFKRAIVVAELSVWERPFHTLRKNCETDWLARGLPVMDVCRWLGHDPRVAAQFYHQTTAETWSRITKDGHDRSHAQSPGVAGSKLQVLRLAAPSQGAARQQDQEAGREPGRSCGGPEAVATLTLVG